MKTQLYIFSAKDGMQWLTAPKNEAPRLTFLRQKLGKLTDFNAGEHPYRGVLIYKETSYIYACFLAPCFDFRGRDATYFIFAEVPTMALRNLDINAILHSEAFTLPLEVFHEEIMLDLSHYTTTDKSNVRSRDVFSNVIHYIEMLTSSTGIRLHQEGSHNVDVTVYNEPALTPQNIAVSQKSSPWGGSASSLQANLQAIAEVQKQRDYATPFTICERPQMPVAKSIKKTPQCQRNAWCKTIWHYLKYALIFIVILIIGYIIYHLTIPSQNLQTESPIIEDNENTSPEQHQNQAKGKENE